MVAESAGYKAIEAIVDMDRAGGKVFHLVCGGVRHGYASAGAAGAGAACGVTRQTLIALQMEKQVPSLELAFAIATTCNAGVEEVVRWRE